MKIKVTFEIENTLNVAQIDENVRMSMQNGNSGATAAEQIREEFTNMMRNFDMGTDINGNKVTGAVTDVMVFTNTSDSSVYSEWHKED